MKHAFHLFLNTFYFLVFILSIHAFVSVFIFFLRIFAVFFFGAKPFALLQRYWCYYERRGTLRLHDIGHKFFILHTNSIFHFCLELLTHLNQNFCIMYFVTYINCLYKAGYNNTICKIVQYGFPATN